MTALFFALIGFVYEQTHTREIAKIIRSHAAHAARGRLLRHRRRLEHGPAVDRRLRGRAARLRRLVTQVAVGRGDRVRRRGRDRGLRAAPAEPHPARRAVSEVVAPIHDAPPAALRPDGHPRRAPSCSSASCPASLYVTIGIGHRPVLAELAGGRLWAQRTRIDLHYLLPEIIVALTGALMLVADLIWPAPTTRDTRRPHVARVPAIAGLLGAGGVGAAAGSARRHDALQRHHRSSTRSRRSSRCCSSASACWCSSCRSRPCRVHALDRRVLRAHRLDASLGSMLLASAAELFTIFLSLQLTSLPLIVLVGYAKRDREVGRGGAEVPAARARLHGGARSTA